MLARIQCNHGKALLGILLLLSALVSFPGWAEPGALRSLVDWENNANNGRGRSDPSAPITHYEIPLEFISQDLSQSMPPDVLGSLIFESKGRKYFRWIVHPEDTYLPELIEMYAKEHKIKIPAKHYYDGWFTASRSLIVHDPESGALFSAKVSTNHLLGKREKKKIDLPEVRLAVQMSDFLERQLKINPSANLVLFPEVAAFGLNQEFTQRPWMAQGLGIRSLQPLLSGEFEYLPAFSAFDDKLGRSIAKMNGSSDPVEYWKTHLIEPLARANAELFARYGLTSLSPHGQNYLLEMKREGKRLVPTGRIAIRDLQEFTVLGSHAESLWGKSARALLKLFPFPWVNVDKKVTHEIWPLGFTPTRNAPAWLSPQAYDAWGEHYFSVFDKEIEQMGFVVREPAKLKKEKYDGEDYTRKFLKAYVVNDSWAAAANACVESNRKLGNPKGRKRSNPK